MKKGKIFILSGPSGSGKTTLYNKLLKTNRNLYKSISVTTRPKRKGEVHGRDYFFVSPKMFDYKRKAGHFLEHQKVFDNYYGTPKKNVLDMIKSGKNVLLCIDVKGAKVVWGKISKAIKIFVKTPNLEILKKRLMSRGSENTEIVDLRLKTAKFELKQAKLYDYTIINDRLPTALSKLKKVVDKELDK